MGPSGFERDPPARLPVCILELPAGVRWPKKHYFTEAARAGGPPLSADVARLVAGLTAANLLQSACFAGGGWLARTGAAG